MYWYGRPWRVVQVVPLGPAERPPSRHRKADRMITGLGTSDAPSRTIGSLAIAPREQRSRTAASSIGPPTVPVRGGPTARENIVGRFDLFHDLVLGDPSPGAAHQPAARPACPSSLRLRHRQPGSVPGCVPGYPSGSSRPADNLYTDSLVALDGRTGGDRNDKATDSGGSAQARKVAITVTRRTRAPEPGYERAQVVPAQPYEVARAVFEGQR
jgi:hypothetical protein